MATDWKRSVFIPIPKKGNAKECSNYHTLALILHASKVMLKFSKSGFSNTLTNKFQMFKLVLEKAEEKKKKKKGRGTRDQIANIHWIVKKAREFQRNIYF